MQLLELSAIAFVIALTTLAATSQVQVVILVFKVIGPIIAFLGLFVLFETNFIGKAYQKAKTRGR